MKSKFTVLLLALLTGALNMSAATTNTYSQTVNLPILDDNPNGVFSSIQVSNIYGPIARISVSLDVSGGFNGDLFGYLVNANTGAYAVLLNRPGVTAGNSFGYSDGGLALTFASGLTNDVHFYQSASYSLDTNGAVVGTWAADGRNIDPGTNSIDLVQAPRTLTLDYMVGTDPNGEWDLFLADFSGGYEGEFKDWQLNLVVVPEPAPGQLIGIGATFMMLYLVRQRCIKKLKASPSTKRNNLT